MRRDTGIPFLIVCVLIGLAAGAAVLGYRQAPSSADLTVHNAAGELTLATKVTAIYQTHKGSVLVLIKYTSPPHVTETLLKGGPPGAKPQQRSASGAAAAAIWTTFRRVQKMTGFVQHGSTYTVSLPVGTLTPEAASKGYHGLFTYTVTVADNYATGITQAFSVTSPSGPLTGGHRYQVLTVNGQPVGASAKRPASKS